MPGDVGIVCYRVATDGAVAWTDAIGELGADIQSQTVAPIRLASYSAGRRTVISDALHTVRTVVVAATVPHDIEAYRPMRSTAGPIETTPSLPRADVHNTAPRLSALTEASTPHYTCSIRTTRATLRPLQEWRSRERGKWKSSLGWD